MSSTTALVLIGTSHPNDAEICPTHIARLLEGDRVTWAVSDVNVLPPSTVWYPNDPSRVFTDLLGIIGVAILGLPTPGSHLRHRRVLVRPEDQSTIDEVADVVCNQRGLALSFMVGHHSVLRPAIPRMQSIEGLDIEIFEPSWSRRWNRWTQQWDLNLPERSAGGGNTHDEPAAFARPSDPGEWMAEMVTRIVEAEPTAAKVDALPPP